MVGVVVHLLLPVVEPVDVVVLGVESARERSDSTGRMA